MNSNKLVGFISSIVPDERALQRGASASGTFNANCSRAKASPGKRSIARPG